MEIEKYIPPSDIIYLRINQPKLNPKIESILLCWQYLKMEINIAAILDKIKLNK